MHAKSTGVNELCRAEAADRQHSPEHRNLPKPTRQSRHAEIAGSSARDVAISIEGRRPHIRGEKKIKKTRKRTFSHSERPMAYSSACGSCPFRALTRSSVQAKHVERSTRHHDSKPAKTRDEEKCGQGTLAGRPRKPLDGPQRWRGALGRVNPDARMARPAYDRRCLRSDDTLPCDRRPRQTSKT